MSYATSSPVDLTRRVIASIALIGVHPARCSIRYRGYAPTVGASSKNDEFRRAALRGDGVSKEDDNTGGSSRTLFECSPIAPS